jgi:hypothetical protein
VPERLDGRGGMGRRGRIPRHGMLEIGK